MRVSALPFFRAVLLFFSFLLCETSRVYAQWNAPETISMASPGYAGSTAPFQNLTCLNISSYGTGSAGATERLFFRHSATGVAQEPAYVYESGGTATGLYFNIASECGEGSVSGNVFFTEVQNKAYFFARGSSLGDFSLRRTDASATSLSPPVCPVPGGGGVSAEQNATLLGLSTTTPRLSFSLNNRMYMAVSAPSSGEELQVMSVASEPNSATNFPESVGAVININTAAGLGSNPEHFVAVPNAGGTFIFFAATLSTGRRQIVRIDNANPTVAGLLTTLNGLNITTPSLGLDPDNLINGGDGFCYFIGNNNDNTGNKALYRSNGGANSVVNLSGASTALLLNPASGSPVRPVRLGSRIYFVARPNTSSPMVLYSVNAGATPGTPVAVAGSPTGITEMVVVGTGTNARLMLAAGGNLYRFDGTSFSSALTDGLGNPFNNPRILRAITVPEGDYVFFVTGATIPATSPGNICYYNPINDDNNRYDLVDGVLTFSAASLTEIVECNNHVYFNYRTGSSSNRIGRLPYTGLPSCPSSVSSFNYGGSISLTLCQGGSSTISPSIVLNPPQPNICPAGNCFTVTEGGNPTTGLSVDPNTGVITLNSSTVVGTYVIGYTFRAASCPDRPAPNTVTVTVQSGSLSNPIQVTTFAGNGSSGTATGPPLTSANFNFPLSINLTIDANIGVRVSGDGTKLYVSDENNHAIRQVDLSNTTNNVTFFAGSNTGLSGYQEGTGTAARFNRPAGIAVDAFGNIYVADKLNHVVRRINPATGQTSLLAGVPNTSGNSDNANLLSATFNQPSGIAIASDGTVYVSDKENHRIRRISASGGVTTLAGSSQGFANGTGASAQFNRPSGLAILPNGDLVVADVGNGRIRRVTPAGVVSTIVSGLAGPTDLAVMPDGNLLVSARSNTYSSGTPNTIRLVNVSAGTESLYAGDSGGATGVTDGFANVARFEQPAGIATTPAGVAYVADAANRRIRKIERVKPAGSVGASATVCATANSGTLTWTAPPSFSGSIVRWESSVNGGSSWTNISNTTNSQAYNNLTQNTLYRVRVDLGSCLGQVYSDTATIQVNATPPPTVPGSPFSVCKTGAAIQNFDLVAQGGFNGEYEWYNHTMGNPIIPGQNNAILTVNVGALAAGTYTYRVLLNKNGCKSTQVNVVLNVVNTPTPTFTAAANICVGQSITYTALPNTGTYTWAITGAPNTGNTDWEITAQSGNTLTVLWKTTGARTITATQTLSGCSGNTSNNIIVNPIPAAPTATNTSVERCGAGSVTLGASGGTAGNYRWYNVATGGTSLANTDTYTTPSLAVGTYTYYVAITNGACESSRVAIAVNVKAIPAAPTVSNTSVSRCGAGTVSLSASGTTDGNYRWYDVATGGTSLGSDGSYTTASLAVGTYTYYVAIVSNGCESSRVAVTVNVNPIPAAPTVSNTTVERCGVGTVSLSASGGTAGNYRWYDVATGGTSLGNNANYTTASLAVGTYTYYVAITNGACESSRVAIAVNVKAIPAAPTVSNTSVSRCGAGTVSLSASGTTDGNYRWYDVATGGTSLGSDGSYTTASLAVGTYTYYVAIVSNGCESSRVAVTVNVNPIPAAPTVSNTTVERCGVGTVSLSASGGTAGNYRWYDVATGGTSLGNNANYTTASLAVGTYTYYVAITNGACESSRVAIAVNVKAIPAAPTVSNTSVSRCGAGTVSLSASGTTDGNYRWYDVATGGTSLGSDGSYTTASLAVGTYTYYVAIVGDGCESSRVAVAVNINPIPTAPTVSNPTPLCGAGSVTLTASGAGAGQSYRWFDEANVQQAETGGSITRTVNASTTFTVKIVDNTTTCESATASISVTVNPPINAPTVSDPAPLCGAGSVTLSASGATGGQAYRWFDAANVQQPETGASITRTVSASTTFTVRIFDPVAGCVSDARTIHVNVVTPPSALITGNFTVCPNDAKTYTAPTAPTGVTYEYNWSVQSGTIQGSNTGQNVTIQWDDDPVQVHYVRVCVKIQGTSCETCSANPPSSGDNGFVNMVNAPNVPLIAGKNQVCVGESITYTVQNPQPNTTYTFTWVLNGGSPNSGATANWAAAGNGIVRVTATNTAGCSSQSADYAVSILTNPSTLPTAQDITSCQSSGTFTLTASSNETGIIEYNWYTVASGGSPTPGNTFTTPNLTANTCYFVSAVNAAGCESPRKQVCITLNSNTFPSTVQATIKDADRCVASGDSPSGSISLTLTPANAGYQYAWSKAGQPSFTATTKDISNLTRGDYSVVITDPVGGCTANFGPYRVNEVLKQVLNARVTENTTIALGTEITLTASADNAVSYVWSVDGVEVGTGANFVVRPTETTTYTVLITNDTDCTITLTVTITVSNLQVFIPNMFAPTSEEPANRLFRVFGTGIESVELRVYNRFNELVFQTNEWQGDRSAGWDGTYKGQALANGNYIWQLRGKFVNGEEIKFQGKTTGQVILMR